MPFIVACALFLFLEGWKRETARRKEETQVRQAEGRNATPLGVPADLQSASSENVQRRYEKPTAADFKSAKKRSNLFCLRIANPQGRLAVLRLFLPPSGLASLPSA